MRIPEYVGPCAFGIKMGIIVPGCDLEKAIIQALDNAHRDGLIEDGDTLCITESIVARAQNNYILTADIAEEVSEKLELSYDSRVGILFPITSRNRFSLILKGIAMAVPQGEVVVQLSYPDDEMGNQIIPDYIAEELEAEKGGYILSEDLDRSYTHPLTGVDYISLYRDIIAKEGAKPAIYLCNNYYKLLEHDPAAVLISSVHNREKLCAKIKEKIDRCMTLQDLFNQAQNRKTWSEWGLLGSNMSSGDKLKLAPREADKIVCNLQKKIKQHFNKTIEVIIYGDGAYKDPSSGIYELADPQPAFGATPRIKSVYRKGLKYKYLIDMYYENGKTEEEIEKIITEEMREDRELDSIYAEGTTPRRMEDILASLADLVSGSADAGTPLVLVKGIFN